MQHDVGWVECVKLVICLCLSHVLIALYTLFKMKESVP